jgi:hypothetical protein
MTLNDITLRSKAMSERLAKFMAEDEEKEPAVIFAAAMCLAAAMTSMYRVPDEVARKTFMTFRNGADEVLLNTGVIR